MMLLVCILFFNTYVLLIVCGSQSPLAHCGLLPNYKYIQFADFSVLYNSILTIVRNQTMELQTNGCLTLCLS